MRKFLLAFLALTAAAFGQTSTPFPQTGYIQIVGNTLAGVPVTVQVDSNGVLATSGGGGGGGGTSSTFGAAFPATGTAQGFKDSTGVNMTFAKVNATNAQLVDGSAVTQPVSGTFWQATQPVSGTFFQATQPVSIAAAIATNASQVGTWNITNISGTVSLPTGAATAAKQPALGTAGTASTDVITVQGIASGTPFNVTLAANQSVNNAQVSGTAISVNNGTSDAGTQRVTLASNSTGQLTLATGANTIGALTANQSVNTTQFGGVAISTGTGAGGTGIPRVTVSNDSTVGLVAGAANIGHVDGQGTAGTPTGGVLTVQGSGSGTALPVSLAANQSVNLAQVAGATIAQGNGTAATAIRVALPTDGTGVVGLNTGTNVIGVTGVAQASTTSGQSGELVQAAVTTAAPAYSNAQTSPLNMTTAGGLRSDTTTINNGTAVSVNDGAVDAGTQRVTQAGDTSVTGQSAQTATVNNILTAASGASATSVSGFGSATVQVNSTGTAGTYIFEGSNDNANFITVPVYNITVFTGTPVTAAVTASSANILYVVPINYNFLRLRIATTITGGSIQAFPNYRRFTWSPAVQQVAQATAGNLNATIGSGTITTVTTVSTLSNTTQLTPGTAATNLGKAINNTPGATDTAVGALYQSRTALAATAVTNNNYDIAAITKYRAQYVFDQEKQMPTYRASTAAGGIALAASATDIAILPGNATNNVFVTKVIISGVQTTAGEVLINIVKRSAANTSGTSAALTSVPLDSGDSAASSLPLSYTANPTPGATVGIIDSAYVTFSPAATGVTNSTYTFNFGERGKGVKLSGVAQGLAVNLNAVTVTGGNAVITYEWREEP